jgi:hypothetical protein
MRRKALLPASVPARQPKRRSTYAIGLSRLPRVDESPGLILLTVDSSGAAAAPRKVGVLTDAALRGRLAHFDAHSANEIAAVRRMLSLESGQATVYETWSSLKGCLGFWSGFTGLQIRPIAWTCDKCGAAGEDRIGGSVGESFPLLCPCGQVTKVCVPKYAPEMDPALRRA